MNDFKYSFYIQTITEWNKIPSTRLQSLHKRKQHYDNDDNDNGNILFDHRHAN